MSSDTLYSIINFSGIAIGATQTLNHNLVCNGRPLVPDRVDLQFPSSFEFVSATATQLTIRNTSNTGGACQAWCHAIHPVERSFGLNPDDGTFNQHMTPQPFCPGSPNGSGGGSAFSTIVYRPGGTASQNVFTTWTTVMAALASLQGTRILQFDDSVTTPIVIPVGAYDMTGVTWSTVPDRIVAVQIPEGVTFTKLRSFADRIHVQFTGATPPIADFGQTAPQLDTVTISNGAQLSSSGTGTLFDVGAAAQFLVGNQAGFFFVSHAVLNVSAAVTVAVVVQGEEASVAASSLTGIVGATLDLFWANSSLLLSTSQPGFLGTLVFGNVTRTFRFPITPIIVSTALGTDAPTELILVDPSGGALTITLPSAALLRGQSICVKNATASANNVTIAANAGDNIDGAANVVLSGDHFFFEVTSDGVHTWYVTAA